MDIGPVDNISPQQQPNKKSPENKPTEKPADLKAGDRVEISLEARRRLSDLAEKAKASEMDAQNNVNRPNGLERVNDDNPEKASTLEEIRKRIESGYYNRPDVMDQIAEKLSDDLES